MRLQTVCRLTPLLVAAVVAGAALAGEVADSPTSIRPLLIGAEVPPVTVSGTDGSTVDLQSLLSGKPSVLIFYRGGW